MGSTLGRNIKTYRKNKGFTQEELAELLNITPQAISKWESESGLPDVSMIIPLAQVLGVSTDALLGYDSISENEEVISRVKETVNAIKEEEKDRAKKALRIVEYLSTETTLNPGCFEIIKDYVKETANSACTQILSWITASPMSRIGSLRSIRMPSAKALI